jgi:hypothetical protein
MEILNIENLPQDMFGTYRKSTLTKARMLTEADVVDRAGIVQTREGTSTFHAGDFLAVGVEEEEYPIRATTMERTKEQVSDRDDEGWALYRTKTTVRALQIPKPFAINRTGLPGVLTGKAGDYYVDDGHNQFIVDQTIFHKTYERV